MTICGNFLLHIIAVTAMMMMMIIIIIVVVIFCHHLHYRCHLQQHPHHGFAQ